VRAIYAALDGSQVASNILPVWVSYPVTDADEKLAELFLGEEQGILLSLLGSDSDSLKQGNEAFDEVLAKHSKHRLATYARLVKGINAARQFKTISDEKESRLEVRAPRAKESVQHLSAAIGAGVLDPLSAEMASAYLADSHDSLGDMKAAADVRPPGSTKAARSTAAKRVTRS